MTEQSTAPLATGATDEQSELVELTSTQWSAITLALGLMDPNLAWAEDCRIARNAIIVQRILNPHKATPATAVVGEEARAAIEAVVDFATGRIDADLNAYLKREINRRKGNLSQSAIEKLGARWSARFAETYPGLSTHLATLTALIGRTGEGADGE